MLSINEKIAKARQYAAELNAMLDCLAIDGVEAMIVRLPAPWEQHHYSELVDHSRVRLVFTDVKHVKETI